MAPTYDPSCIFCKIAKGEIPSHRVYEDPHTFAFLDIHPLAAGHALVIPKTHAVLLENLSNEEAGALMNAARDVSRRAKAAVGATASTIALNNGRDAGQEVQHVHVHVVPRTKGDGFGPIHALFTERPETTPEALASLAEKMRKK